MEKVKFSIDGKTIEGVRDQSIMEIARDSGITIPGLCYHPEVKSSGGSCRLCLVEVHQAGRMRVVTACNYPVRETIEVKQETPLIKRLRKTILELLLARVPDSDVIKELALEAGITETRFKKDEGDDNRYKCIACQLCTQVCEEVVGVSAISMLSRGPDKTPGTPYKKASATCIGCGACVYVCPTNAITMKDSTGIRKIWGREFTMHACSACGNHFIPDAQIDFIVKTTGKERTFFDKCPDCR